jgi:O-antigen ligase
MVITYALIFLSLFFLEGLHKTKMVLPMIFFGLMGTMTVIAVAPKLPYTFQRALSFLPIPVDPQAKRDAEGTAEWRLQIWKAVMPQIPKHLLLGTGYALSAVDWINLRTRSEGSMFTEDWDATVVGDYHNGPLSVILPFGIWGLIAFVWFLVAAVRVLYFNHQYAPPELQTINTFLFASFITKALLFFVVFGALNSDMQQFVGLIGLSISLNGGVCRPKQEPVTEAKKSEELVNLFSRRRPMFQR